MGKHVFFIVTVDPETGRVVSLDRMDYRVIKIAHIDDWPTPAQWEAIEHAVKPFIEVDGRELCRSSTRPQRQTRKETTHET